MAGFVDNVIKVSTGNIVALAISLLSLPLITRLYTPEHYGVLLIVNSFVATIVPTAALGYEKALLMPRQNGTVSNVFVISIITVAIVSIMAGGGIFLTLGQLNSLLGLPKDALYVMFIPVGIFLFGIHRVMEFWAIRASRFTEQAISRVCVSVFDRGTAILGGCLNANALWLLTARLAGAIGGIIAIQRALKSDSGLAFNFSAVTVKRLHIVISRYLGFVLSAFATFLNGFARELPPLLLASLYSPVSAGFYGLARVTIGMPFFQVSDSISAAFFHKVASLHLKREDVVGPTLKLLRFQMLIAICPLAVLIVTGDVLTPYLFGQQWAAAGKYAQVLGIVFFIAYLYRPVSVFLDIFEYQRARLVINILLIAVSAASLYAGKEMGGELLALEVFGAAVACAYLSAIHYILKRIGASSLPFFWLSLKLVVLAVLFILPLLMLRVLAEPGPLAIVFVVLVTLVAYATFLFMFEPEIKVRIRQRFGINVG